MATVYTTLKARILDNLKNVSELDTDNIFSDPKAEISGYPAAIFYPTDGEVDFETTSDDERQYNFTIQIMYEYDQGGIGNALDALYDCVDNVMDEFSTDRILDGISMPTGTVLLLVNPVSAGWGELPNKKVIVATVNLVIRVSVQSSS